MTKETFKIEKDIPVPETRGRHAKYPFNQMKVGESFEYPSTLRIKIALAASQHGKRHKQRFTTRVTNGTGRCWRVK